MEQSVYHPQGDKQVPLNLRATVDGDARWNHRHSLDESAGLSITKLDPSDYLKGYQSSIPKKLGIYIFNSWVCIFLSLSLEKILVQTNPEKILVQTILPKPMVKNCLPKFYQMARQEQFQI